MWSFWYVGRGWMEILADCCWVGLDEEETEKEKAKCGREESWQGRSTRCDVQQTSDLFEVRR